jgi:GNAT superfamily N-acetyltransferase
MAPDTRRLGRDSFGDVTAVLCDAFADYPVMRYVLGTDGGDYSSRLTALVGFFVSARLLRNDVILGSFDGPELTGVAMVTLPETTSPPALDAARERLWTGLGREARYRYDAFGRGTASFATDMPHLHLDMLGVRAQYQGRGIARRLLDRVHAFSRERADSRGVTLTTEYPGNLTMYGHFGYRLTGHARIAPELESWGMLRTD